MSEELLENQLDKAHREIEEQAQELDRADKKEKDLTYIIQMHEKEIWQLTATIELGYKEETKLIKEIQSLREKNLEQIKLLADMQDTNETIATAYEDEKKENHYLKQQNLKHMTKKDTDDKIFMGLKKDLEVLKHNLEIQDAMHAETLGERNRLEKSNYKMQGKNQKLGAKVMRLEKDLRIYDTSMWKEYQEEYKDDKNAR